MTGAELVWKVMEEVGVDVVFGIPGGAILPLVDAMADTSVRLVITRHESAAVHAADGYARASGRVGVALATSGPGGTNLVTGLVTALTDSVPLVVLVGQVATHLLGSDAFQEADIYGITMPAVKHSWRIMRVEDIAPVMREAVRTARSGRPGPVVVEIPKDVQMASGADYAPAGEEEARGSLTPAAGVALRRLEKAMRRSRRPLLYVGGGVIASDTAGSLRALAEAWGAPVATTLMGLGAFPFDHPQNLGMLGMHGTWTANNAMQAADLVVALGARFDDRVTGKVSEFAPHATIAHLDIDPAEIGKIVRPAIGVAADLRLTLPRLARFARAQLGDRREALAEWWRLLRTWQREHPLKMPDPTDGAIPSPRLMRLLSEQLADDDIVVTEVGQHQMWAALYLGRRKPRTFLTSGGSGTMGYGFPAAIGAQFARPDRRVFLLAGDGSFQMNLQEMATVAQYQVPIWILVLNNQSHGMVRQWQDLFHGERHMGSLLQNPDFTKIADAFGIRSVKVPNEAALAEVLAMGRQLGGPVLVEVDIPPEENVFPMVPAGAPLGMVLEG